MISPEMALVGASTAVALRDIALGYGQAFHALAVARHRPERYVQFTHATDLASLLPPEAMGLSTR